MRIIVPGHQYLLDSYDGEIEIALTFMQRVGPNYPGNTAGRAGTNCQDVIRSLIDRVHYLNGQHVAPENDDIIHYLRAALYSFERRAARLKGIAWKCPIKAIELLPACRICGHIFPHEHHPERNEPWLKEPLQP
jgi:hypothetical protein